MKEKISASLDGGESSDLGREAKVLALSKLSLNDYPEEPYNMMEVSYNVAGVDSSSISSSGSEAGIFTNDEGREGIIKHFFFKLNSHEFKHLSKNFAVVR